MLFLDLVVQLIHQAHSAGGADVGQNQLLFQLVVQVVVDLAWVSVLTIVLEKAGAGLFQPALDLLLFLKFFF